MTEHTHITGKLEITGRLPSSRNGNPRYLLEVNGVACRTAPDSSIAYEVANFNGKIVDAILFAYHGKTTIARVKHAEKVIA